MAEELARDGVGDDGALVADDGIVDPRLGDVRADGAEHPAGDDDDVHAGRAGRGDRGLRARPKHGVLGDERAVEVDRERGEGPGEGRRKLDRGAYGTLPPVDFTT